MFGFVQKMVGSKPSSLKSLSGSSEHGPQHAWSKRGVPGKMAPERVLPSGVICMVGSLLSTGCGLLLECGFLLGCSLLWGWSLLFLHGALLDMLNDEHVYGTT